MYPVLYIIILQFVCVLLYILLVYLDKFRIHSVLENNNNKIDVSMKNIKYFNKIFWLTVLGQFFSITVTVCFVNNMQGFLIYYFNMTPDNASTFLIIPYAYSIILIPLIGFYNDNYGNRGACLCLAAILQIIAFLFIFSDNSCLI